MPALLLPSTREPILNLKDPIRKDIFLRIFATVKQPNLHVTSERKRFMKQINYS